MPPGRLWSVAGRQVRSTLSRPAWSITATSSRASAPQPMTRTRDGSGTADARADGGYARADGANTRSGRASPRSGRTGSALVDQAPRGLGRHPGVAAVGIRADCRAELLVQRRPTDEHDVVVPDAS